MSYGQLHNMDFVLDPVVKAIPINTHYIYVPWSIQVWDIGASTFGCQGCGRIAYQKRGEIAVCHRCDRELYCVYCTRILESDEKESEEVLSLYTLQQYDYVRKCNRKPCNACHYDGAYRNISEGK